MSPKADFSDWNPRRTDKAKIERDIFIPCRICEELFRRIRLTKRYCQECRKGYCEGEHGILRNRGLCLVCLYKAK